MLENLTDLQQCLMKRTDSVRRRSDTLLVNLQEYPNQSADQNSLQSTLVRASLLLAEADAAAALRIQNVVKMSGQSLFSIDTAKMQGLMQTRD